MQGKQYTYLMMKGEIGEVVEDKINQLLEYYDKVFIEEKCEIDEWGKMGTHYMGLTLDLYFSESIYDIDYLSIENYFDVEAGVPYKEDTSLCQQYGKLDMNSKIKVISCILNLIKASSRNADNKEYILNKSISFLKRFGLEIIDNAEKIEISDKYQLFSGTYCNVYFYNSMYYMKQLKSQYASKKEWVARFKYEYENMEKLVDSPFVLKVFNYDKDNNSYLMEKCDCNLDDYLKKNTVISDERLLELIYEILDGIIDVHNAGIIHRDIHLGNILMKDGHIVLSDFGLSKDTMITHSLKSTSTPKNSHFFMDPVGLTDFTRLDKLSDIYSIGKIIDYITKDSSLNEKLSFCISKAIDRDRQRRYRSIDDLKRDIESTEKEMEEVEKDKIVLERIKKGMVTPDVAAKINDLVVSKELAFFIIHNSLLNFDKILNQLSVNAQYDALRDIYTNYQEATGYGGFENYDVFANIAYRYIEASEEIKNQKVAYKILQGCAGYRYNAQNNLTAIQKRYPNIK